MIELILSAARSMDAGHNVHFNAHYIRKSRIESFASTDTQPLRVYRFETNTILLFEQAKRKRFSDSTNKKGVAIMVVEGGIDGADVTAQRIASPRSRHGPQRNKGADQKRK